jgi:hypothetical protein
MGSNATEHNIRELPIYRLGFNDGHDLGLRQALDAITSERVRLARATTDDPHLLRDQPGRHCRRVDPQSGWDQPPTDWSTWVVHVVPYLR